jgi:hypothetical protein
MVMGKKRTNSRKVDTTRQTITMTPKEQLAFWKALTARPKLTTVQKKLGRLMRGGTAFNPPC